jgi:hypothetical protein
VCGSDDGRAPWSQVYSFTFQQGAARAGGAPVYAVLDDFGYNAENTGSITFGRRPAHLSIRFASAPRRPPPPPPCRWLLPAS